MKILLTTLIFILISVEINSQDAYIYTPKGKIGLKYSLNKVLMTHPKGMSQENLKKSNRFLEFNNVSDSVVNFFEDSISFSVGAINRNKIKNKAELLSFIYKDTSLTIWPFMETPEGNLIGIRNKINIKLKPGSKIEDFQKLLKNNAVIYIEKNKFIDGFFQLTIKSNRPIDVVNKLVEGSYFEYAEIDAILYSKKSTEDPSFDAQWAIPRMRVEQAWNLSTGSEIIISILDDGVDITHPDLINNLLNTGFDATGSRNDATPRSYDGHGTSCAGIACARANNFLGGAGIAYSSKLLPVRVAYGNWMSGFYTTPAWISGAFFNVTNLGTDIISCSWSVAEVAFFSIESAINYSATNGRGGKGCLIFASSGNTEEGGVSTVCYPSRLSNVISVGSSNQADLRTFSSNFGPGLNLVACGTNLYTTDLSGANGYSSGDYTDFSGTSAASPAAAGVMALILSVNPYLDRETAQRIMESTCDKIGNYTYSPATNGTKSSETGYGRINAGRAVNETFRRIIHISGVTDMCQNVTGTYTLNRIPPNSTVTWGGQGFNCIGGQGSTTAQMKSNGQSGDCIVRATFTNACGTFDVEYHVWVGAPSVTSINGPSSVQINQANSFYAYSNSSGVSYNWWTSPSTNTRVYPYPEYGMANIYFDYPGGYTVFAQAYNSCGQTTPLGKFVMVSPSGYMMSLSPNPASDNVKVSIADETNLDLDEHGKTNTNENTIYTISLLSSNGIKIHSEKTIDKKITLSTSGLKNGTYIIEISDGKNKYSQQFIVKH